jgi:hypothetical protein
MTPLIIGAEDDITPSVTLDSGKNVFEITGWSHPEDAIAFYTPVLNWLGQYEKTPNASTEFHCKFQYYNTASAKQIFRIVSALEEVAKKSKVTIHWHFDEEDTDMQAAGERFSKMSTIPFKFVSNQG